MILKVIGSSPVTYLIVDFYKLVTINKNKKTKEINNIKVISLYFLRFYGNLNFFNFNNKRTQETNSKKNKNIFNRDNNISSTSDRIYFYNVCENFFLLLLNFIFTIQTTLIINNRNKLRGVVLTSSLFSFNFYYLFLSKCILNYTNNNLYKKNSYINIKVNFKNFNCKVSLFSDSYNNSTLNNSTLDQSIFVSYGTSLKKFNILQKSLRRSKKFYSIFLNNLRDILLRSKILFLKDYSKSNQINSVNINIFVSGCFYSNNFIKSFSLLINEIINKSNDKNFNFFFKPNFRNSSNIYKKVKAIKKRIKKKLINKYYKS